MTYLLSDRKKSGRFNKLLKLSSFIFFACLLVSIFFWFFHGGLQKISFKAGEILNLLPLTAIFKDKIDLELENQKLKEENVLLLSLASDRDLLAKNIEELETLDSEDENTILSRVIGKPGSTPYDVLFVDKGIEEKISFGKNVYSGSIIIGKIEEVLGGYSRVLLFTSKGNIIKASILESGTFLELAGIGGGLYESFIPSGEPIENSDLIVSENGKKVIGKVDRIISNDGDTLKRLIVRPDINPFEIKWVNIEK